MSTHQSSWHGSVYGPSIHRTTSTVTPSLSSAQARSAGERDAVARDGQREAHAITQREAGAARLVAQQSGPGRLIAVDRHDLNVERRHDFKDLVARRAAIDQLATTST